MLPGGCGAAVARASAETHPMRGVGVRKRPIADAALMAHPVQSAAAVRDASVLLLLLLSVACGDPNTRPTGTLGSARAPRAPAEVDRPKALTSIESSKKDALGRSLRVACVTCHSLRKSDTLPTSTAELDEFHVGLQFQHGKLNCASCHVPGKVGHLRLADGNQVEMRDVVELCSQCHSARRKGYDHSAHGGLQGSWDPKQGKQYKASCVSCHDPHMPKYIGGAPVLPPKDRGLENSTAGAH